MKIPRYWAEAILREPDGKRIIRIRRFGWSDSNQTEAQAVAESRAQEAMARTKAGESVDRSEPRVAYNGADGMPIREQILAEHGDTVITRNSYGAHCLNTPSVLFLDIDYADPNSSWDPLFFGLALVFGLLAAVYFSSPALGIATFIPAFCIACVVAHLVSRSRRSQEEEKVRAAARHRFDQWMGAHPNWRVRLYETPAGLRVLVTSDLFDPASEGVSKAFADLQADSQYARMCIRQRCFRARLTAKPWRVGVQAHMVPRPGVWPLSDDKLPRRNAWIEKYEAAAANFAACRFIGEFGTGAVHQDADAVRRLHDELSGALSGKPIA